MQRFEDFASHLERKIRKDIEAEFQSRREASMETKTSSSLEIDELPMGFAWILGQNFSAAANAQTQVSPAAKAHRAYGVKPKPARPHILNAEQSVARSLFAKYGALLGDTFNKSDLRSMWRKVAKATHPDQGGSNEAFRAAEAAYKTLQTVFAK